MDPNNTEGENKSSVSKHINDLVDHLPNVSEKH